MANTDQQLNIEEEKKDSISLFSENLVNVLSMDSLKNSDILDLYNITLIKVLVEEPRFKLELEKALYRNLEKITHKKFYLEDKTHAPSIRNWLKDFIKKQGTDIYDDMTISMYITDSANAKLLDDEEKLLIRKLLKLYRNIKFFPENQKNLPVEEWEIIPTEKSPELTKARTVSGPPKTETEKKIDRLSEKASQYEEGSLEKKVIKEEISDKKNIEQLKYKANQYPVGSLERKAIEEEIRKLDLE